MYSYSSILGNKFGKLKPLYPMRGDPVSGTNWLCKCDCGVYTFARGFDLKRGKRKSCGCMQDIQNPVTNFEKHFTKTKTDDCWDWNAYCLPSGYGLFQISNRKGVKHWLAHRFSYTVYVDDTPLSEEDIICHKCDNPSCVNPNHLFKGTTQDNVNDKIDKGRDVRGENVHCSKLNAQDVIDIRRLVADGNIKKQDIAKMFNISPSGVTNIYKRKIWKHVL